MIVKVSLKWVLHICEYGNCIFTSYNFYHPAICELCQEVNGTIPRERIYKNIFVCESHSNNRRDISSRNKQNGNDFRSFKKQFKGLPQKLDAPLSE